MTDVVWTLPWPLSRLSLRDTVLLFLDDTGRAIGLNRGDGRVAIPLPRPTTRPATGVPGRRVFPPSLTNTCSGPWMP